MQIIQAAAAAQADAEPFPDELMDPFPVPVGQADARCLRQSLDRFFQRRPLRLAEGGGGGGTPGLLENQGGRPALAKGGGPSSDGVWIPSQGLRRTRSRPSLG